MQKLVTLFSRQNILMGLVIALAFSLSIYLFHFGYEFYLLNSFLGVYSLYLMIISDRKILLVAGFFIGLFWFYWIGFSFTYYGFPWAIPLVSLFFALAYSLIFWLIGYKENPFIRGALLFLLSLFEPFDFNWLQPELIFVHSYFGIEKYHFALILLALSSFVYFKHRAILLLLVPALSLSANAAYPSLPLNVSLVQTTIPQEEKWKPRNLRTIVRDNFKAIDKAIEEKKELVVLPESAFPLFLNRESFLLHELKIKSTNIAIITGSLYAEKGRHYNATYFFHNGTMKVAKKMILVPFGEHIPLPEFLADPINKIVFGGVSDYLSASEATYFSINDLPFKNAICYEATCHELYEDNPQYMIATSNNAWFLPSIQPTLQRLLMKFYAKKHNTIILHSANGSGGGIIYP